jgi:phosphorylcholine metabolism protein LicD
MRLTAFTHALLDRHQIVHWLDYGSLLGAVRDGQLIAWDSDVDIGILATDRDRLTALASEIASAGHRLDRSDPDVARINLSAKTPSMSTSIAGLWRMGY